MDTNIKTKNDPTKKMHSDEYFLHIRELEYFNEREHSAAYRDLKLRDQRNFPTTPKPTTNKPASI